MGVFGVALATVISQYISFAACAVFAVKKVSYFKLDKEDLRSQKKIIFESFRLGIPIALQNSMIAISMMVLPIAYIFGETIIRYSTGKWKDKVIK